MNENTTYSVPLLPISAQGGSLNDFVVSVKDIECEKVISPIKGVDYAITVSGESMSPEYPSGSQVLIKKINERAFIDWGRVYVLDTCNGTVIKRLFPSDTTGCVVCKSINPEYPPFEVSMEDVYGVYRVLMCMSMK
ncbi:MAG: helix-turn-helix transcriptional regulator [Prevotella sp.]